MTTRTWVLSAGAIALLTGTPRGVAQSLYERESPPPRDEGIADRAAAPDHGADPQSLAAVSLLAVEPPEPRIYVKNDLITIIVSERTIYDRSVETESEKSVGITADVSEFIDLLELLQLRVVNEDGVPVAVDLGVDNQFEGEGTFEQEDRMTDRITARVLEVKPNGTLLLEAKRSLVTDDSEFVLTMSGSCRSEDITVSNTVQSNQLYDMVLQVENSGELRRTTSKGVITRLLETLFHF